MADSEKIVCPLQIKGKKSFLDLESKTKHIDIYHHNKQYSNLKK